MTLITHHMFTWYRHVDTGQVISDEQYWEGERENNRFMDDWEEMTEEEVDLHFKLEGSHTDEEERPDSEGLYRD